MSSRGGGGGAADRTQRRQGRDRRPPRRSGGSPSSPPGRACPHIQRQISVAGARRWMIPTPAGCARHARHRSVPKSTLEQFGRYPFVPGAAEADRVELGIEGNLLRSTTSSLRWRARNDAVARPQLIASLRGLRPPTARWITSCCSIHRPGNRGPPGGVGAAGPNDTSATRSEKGNCISALIATWRQARCGFSAQEPCVIRMSRRPEGGILGLLRTTK